MTRKDWDRLSPSAAKGVVRRIGRASRTAQQWEKSMQEVVPGTPAVTTTTHPECHTMWMGMWMAWHRGQVISGSAR